MKSFIVKAEGPGGVLDDFEGVVQAETAQGATQIARKVAGEGFRGFRVVAGQEGGQGGRCAGQVELNFQQRGGE